MFDLFFSYVPFCPCRSLLFYFLSWPRPQVNVDLLRAKNERCASVHTVGDEDDNDADDTRGRMRKNEKQASGSEG
jgi:hypothetical protein